MAEKTATLYTKINGQIVKVNPNTGDNPIVKLSVKGHTVTYVRKDGTKGIYKG